MGFVFDFFSLLSLVEFMDAKLVDRKAHCACFISAAAHTCDLSMWEAEATLDNTTASSRPRPCHKNQKYGVVRWLSRQKHLPSSLIT